MIWFPLGVFALLIILGLTFIPASKRSSGFIFSCVLALLVSFLVSFLYSFIKNYLPLTDDTRRILIHPGHGCNAALYAVSPQRGHYGGCQGYLPCSFMLLYVPCYAGYIVLFPAWVLGRSLFPLLPYRKPGAAVHCLCLCRTASLDQAIPDMEDSPCCICSAGSSVCHFLCFISLLYLPHPSGPSAACCPIWGGSGGYCNSIHHLPEA